MTLVVMTTITKNSNKLQEQQKQQKEKLNISKEMKLSMAALCQKSCDFCHLKLGMAQTYNSLLLFTNFVQFMTYTAQCSAFLTC